MPLVQYCVVCSAGGFWASGRPLRSTGLGSHQFSGDMRTRTVGAFVGAVANTVADAAMRVRTRNLFVPDLFGRDPTVSRATISTGIRKMKSTLNGVVVPLSAM